MIRALMNEFNALKNEAPESSLASSAMRGYREKAVINEEASPHQTLNLTAS